jgi:magnesium chelatase family protein
MKTEQSIWSLVESDQTGLVVEIECHLSKGLPNIIIVGYANKAVDEAKERIRSAFSSSNIELPRKRITINLAPADIPKESTGFDLAIACALLNASNQMRHSLPATAVMGELGLEGDVRPLRGIIGKLLVGKRHGIETFIIPEANVTQARLVPGIRLIPVSSLKQLYKFLNEPDTTQPINTDMVAAESSTVQIESEDEIGLEDVIGQELGKRAVEISAAGGHNLLLGGPPGTGKSMLAKILPGLLPPLNREEMLEVTHLHSLASHDFNQIVTTRPFRSPHHSASNVAIVGGGNSVRPGEMSLSHRGVLLFDELPEFNRVTVEALRQPLESRTVTIARAKETAEYPAHFIFVATANPCPCGNYRTAKECRCLPHQITHYRRKLSGPILDRIDLYVDVHEIDNSYLLAERAASPNTTATARQRIAAARALQHKRFKGTKLNADMTNREIKAHAKLEPTAKDILDQAAARFGLSARSYMRSVKVARTIADLDSSEVIAPKHIGEALQYRSHAYHNDI